MNETALRLGPDQNLVAILTPAEVQPRPVAVLLLNAGVIHRIGPHRTSVKLARRLAADGHTCVRFDVSGVGDSRPPRDAAEFRVQAVNDVRAVMDHLEREYGFHSFALFGICAGAVNAYATALVDPRVTGAFMVDGYLFTNWKTHLHRALALWRAYGAAELLAKVMRVLARPLSKRATSADRNGEDSSPSTHHPTRDEFAADLQSMTDRGVRVALMCTGSFLEKHSYVGQWRDTFRGHGFVDKVQDLFAPDIDHTMTTLAAQHRLLDLVAHWAQQVEPRRASTDSA